MATPIDFLQMASTLATPTTGQHYPLEQWQPSDCGILPLEIDKNGNWWSLDDGRRTPYQRVKLVKLLSKLLWCEPADYDPSKTLDAPSYSLRTPHESVSIQVVDTPFLIIDYHWHNSAMICTTQLGDNITIGLEHPVVLNAQSPNLPYALVRRNLWARFNRNTYYRLIDELLKNSIQETENLGFTSQNHYFTLTPLV